MPERKIKLPLGPNQIDATEVPIVSKNEVASEYQLEDGSLIRVLCPVMQVMRIDGAFDADGYPVYVARNGSVVTVVSVPDHLKKR